MSDGQVEVARITIRKLVDVDAVDVAVSVEPRNMPVIDILGLLTFAQHEIAIDQVEPRDP